MAVKLVRVKEQDDGMRLNRWFLKYYPDLPLSRLQKLLRTKQIKVDGKKAENILIGVSLHKFESEYKAVANYDII